MMCAWTIMKRAHMPFVKPLTCEIGKLGRVHYDAPESIPARIWSVMCRAIGPSIIEH